MTSCRCKFRGFEAIRLCGKHAKEMSLILMHEARMANDWRKIANGLYEVVMCDLNDNLCHCADHVAAYQVQLKKEDQ